MEERTDIVNTLTLKSVKENRFLKYVKTKCPHCQTEIVANLNEVIKCNIPFEPHDEECDEFVWDTDLKRLVKKKIIRTVTSDRSKDTVVLHCSNCGCDLVKNSIELQSDICDYKGDDHIVFELNDKETEAARAFMRKHYKKCTNGKPFTALGMLFTYEITPGGLGPIISIKCNNCKETQVISSCDDW